MTLLVLFEPFTTTGFSPSAGSLSINNRTPVVTQAMTVVPAAGTIVFAGVTPTAIPTYFGPIPTGTMGLFGTIPHARLVTGSWADIDPSGGSWTVVPPSVPTWH